MKVSKKFIEEYVSSFSGYGGQINKEDLVNGDFTICDTTLTKSDIESIKSYNNPVKKFMILVANGHGWGTAWLCDDGALQGVRGL